VLLQDVLHGVRDLVLRSLRAFGADLLNKGCRSERRHQKRCDKNRADNGFSAVEDNITRDSDDGQNECKHAFKRDLQKFDEPDDGSPDGQCRHFGRRRNPGIAEKRVT
jgi:hypothetical protein